MNIAPKVAFAGHPRHGAEEIAINEQDALVAFAVDLGDQRLHNRAAGLMVRDRLDEPVDIAVAVGQQKHTFTPVTIDRFDHGLPTDVTQEPQDLIPMTRHDRGGHDLREVMRVELFVGVAQSPRIIDDEGASLEMVEDESQPQVLVGERRVLSNEHGVGSDEVDVLSFGQFDRLSRVALHGRFADAR